MNKFIAKYLVIFTSFISLLFFSLIFFNKFMTEKMIQGGGIEMMAPEGPPPAPPEFIPLVFICILSAIFVFMIFKYIDKNFISPLENIEKIVKKIKEGQYDVLFETKSESETVVDAFNTLNNMVEGLREKEKLQNNFIRNMVHDLRAPITASNRAMDILEDEIDKELFSALKENNDAYLKLVNGIIESITNKEVKIEKTYFKLCPLADIIIKALQFSAEKKNITINNKIADDFIIFADYISTNRIILNLLSNAIENNKDNEITLKAFDKDVITLIVEDNGCGIKDVKKLFKNHISVNNSGEKSVSGLGLSIVKEMVEANDGEITVETEENKYTRFIVKFPKGVKE